MVKFLKENGFPMTVIVETQMDYEDKENDKGYYSTMKDENGNVLGEFCHSDIRARIHWVNGFFTALRMSVKPIEKEPVNSETESDDDKYVVYEYNENASPAYRGSRFMTTYDASRDYTQPDDSKVIVVGKNIGETEAYQLINERHDTNISAYLSSLPEQLKGKGFIKNILEGE